ncbi:MAG: hypothetical protein ACI4RN_00865 [Oscillospiraceae bacterium]
MRKSTVFLIIAVVMSVVGMSFVLYALGHPESSWNLPSIAVSILYIVYLLINVFCYVAFGVLRHKGK